MHGTPKNPGKTAFSSRKSDPDGTRTRVAAVKGREHPLATASTQGTCDDAQNHFPQRVPLFPGNGNADDTPDAVNATAGPAWGERDEGDDGTPVDQLAKLAAAVAALAPADRERLAALLAGPGGLGAMTGGR